MSPTASRSDPSDHAIRDLGDGRFRKILSGETNGPGGLLTRLLLSGLVPLYRLGLAFDRWRSRKPFRPPVPVISVGNITVGGTGKTPVTAWVARTLVAHGRKPAVLARGYGAGDDGSNDEAAWFRTTLPGVPYIENPDRAAGAREAVGMHGADVLLLDDGFQHRRIARDLDVVLIDAMNPFGFDRLLPRGLLREPLSALARAGLVMLTRCEGAPEERLAGIEGRLRRFTEAPVLRCRFVAGGIRPLEVGGAPIEPGKVCLACGIGNPEGFAATAVRAGLDIVAEIRFPDHHRYGGEDVDRIRNHARTHGADTVLVTEKDAVKLRHLHTPPPPPAWGVLPVAADFADGVETLRRHLYTAVDVPPT